MKTVAQQLRVFPSEGACLFLLDRVEFVARLMRLPSGVVPPMQALDAVVESLTPAPKRVGRSMVAVLDDGRAKYRHHLGAFLRGDGNNVSALVSVNVNRRLRDALAAAGHYDAKRASKLGRDDNFIDPTYLSPSTGIDLHGMALAELLRSATEVREQYVKNMKLLFGYVVPLESVGVSIATIELNWDRVCALARHAPTAFWKGWMAENSGAGRGLDLPGEPPRRVLLRGSTDTREVDAVAGTSVLVTCGVKGDSLKLYVKHDRLLRFEMKLTGKRAAVLLGHAIRMDNVENLKADLESLAMKRYPSIIRVQNSIENRTYVDPLELVGRFYSFGGRSHEKVTTILRALGNEGKFHHRNQSHKNILPSLKEAGLITYLPGSRGEWGAMPWVARVLAVLSYETRGLEDSLDAAPPASLPSAARVPRATRKVKPSGRSSSGASDA